MHSLQHVASLISSLSSASSCACHAELQRLQSLTEVHLADRDVIRLTYICITCCTRCIRLFGLLGLQLGLKTETEQQALSIPVKMLMLSSKSVTEFERAIERRMQPRQSRVNKNKHVDTVQRRDQLSIRCCPKLYNIQCAHVRPASNTYISTVS